MSHCMRRQTTCIGENKDADQLCSNCTADQHLFFRYTDSTIPLLPKSEISSFYPSSVTVQSGVCQTWSETQIVGFVIQRLISSLCVAYPDNISLVGIKYKTNKLIDTKLEI